MKGLHAPKREYQQHSSEYKLCRAYRSTTSNTAAYSLDPMIKLIANTTTEFSHKTLVLSPLGLNVNAQGGHYLPSPSTGRRIFRKAAGTELPMSDDVIDRAHGIYRRIHSDVGCKFWTDIWYSYIRGHGIVKK